VLDKKSVDLYMEAVQDNSSMDAPYESADLPNLAPPMSVAALSLRGVVNDLKIPGGTLHVGQEMTYTKPVEVGGQLDCVAVLTSNNVRGDWRFMVVDLQVSNSAGKIVMDGKSTIMLPA
jgi:acyl dehydratase